MDSSLKCVSLLHISISKYQDTCPLAAYKYFLTVNFFNLKEFSLKLNVNESLEQNITSRFFPHFFSAFQLRRCPGGKKLMYPMTVNVHSFTWKLLMAGSNLYPYNQVILHPFIRDSLKVLVLNFQEERKCVFLKIFPCIIM